MNERTNRSIPGRHMAKDGDEFRDSAFRSLHVVQRYLRLEIDEF